MRVSQAIAAAAFAADSHAAALNADLASTRDELARLKSRMASLASQLESQTSLESVGLLAGADNGRVGGVGLRAPSSAPQAGPSPPHAAFAATAAKFALARVASEEGAGLQTHMSAASGFVTREHENLAASAAELALLAMLPAVDQERVAGTRDASRTIASLPERFSSSSSDADSEPRLGNADLASQRRPEDAVQTGDAPPSWGTLHGKSLLRISEVRSREISERAIVTSCETSGGPLSGSTVSGVGRIRNVYAPVLGTGPEKQHSPLPAVDAHCEPNFSAGKDPVANAAANATTRLSGIAGRPRSRSCDEGLGASYRASQVSASSEYDCGDVEESGTSARVAFAAPLGLSKTVSLPGFWRSLTGGAPRARDEPRGSVPPHLAADSSPEPASSVRGRHRAQSVLSTMFGGLRLSRPSPLRSFSRAEQASVGAWDAGPDLVHRVPVNSSSAASPAGADAAGCIPSPSTGATLPRRRSASYPDASSQRLPGIEGIAVPQLATRAHAHADLSGFAANCHRIGDLLFGRDVVWRDVLRARATAAFAAVLPCPEANVRRADLVAFISGLLKLSCGLQCVVVGTTATRTYLPDSTIDMVVLLPARQGSHFSSKPDPAAALPPGPDSTDHGFLAPVIGTRPWFISVNEALCNAAATCHSAARAARSNASTHSGGAESIGSRSRAAESARRGSSSPLLEAAPDPREAAIARLTALCHGLSVAAGCFSVSAANPAASLIRQKSDAPEPSAPGVQLSLAAAVDAAAFGFLAAAVDDPARLLAYVTTLSAANERIVESLQQVPGSHASAQLAVDVELLREACAAAAIVRALYEASTERSESPIAAANDLADSEYGSLLLSLAEGAAADGKQRPRSGSGGIPSGAGSGHSVTAAPSGLPPPRQGHGSARVASPATAQQIAAAVRAVFSRGQPKWAIAADGKAVSLRNVTFHLGSQWPDFRRDAATSGVTRPYVTCVLDNVRVCIMGSEQHVLPRLPVSVNRLKDILAPSPAAVSTEAARVVAHHLPLQVGATSPCHEIVRCAAFEDWTAALDSASSAVTLVSQALPGLRSPDGPGDVDVAVFTRCPAGDPLFLQADFVEDVEKVPDAPAFRPDPLTTSTPSWGVTQLPSLGPDHDRAVRAMLPHVRQTLVRVATMSPSGEPSFTYSAAPPSRLAKQAVVLVTAWIRRAAASGLGGASGTTSSFAVSDSMAISTALSIPTSAKDGASEVHAAPSLSLRAVEILVLALFVEAAKCAAVALLPGGGAAPSYACSLPPGGFFSHPFDVLASFVSVYATLDFASVVVSPLHGIVPLSHYVAALSAASIPVDSEGPPQYESGSLYALLETSFSSECKSARAQAIASALMAVMQGGPVQSSGRRPSRTRLDSCVSVDSAESEKQHLQSQRQHENGSSGPLSVAQSDASFSSLTGTVFASPAGGRLRRVLDADTVARISALTAKPTVPLPQPMATLRRAASSVVPGSPSNVASLVPGSGVFRPFSVRGTVGGASFEAPLPADVIGCALRVGASVAEDATPAIALSSLLETTLHEVLAAHLPHALRASGAAYSRSDASACVKHPWASSSQAIPSFFHAQFSADGVGESVVATLAQASNRVVMHVVDILNPWVNQCAGIDKDVPGALRAVCLAGCDTLMSADRETMFASFAAPVALGSTPVSAVASRHDMLHHPMQSRVLQASQTAYAHEALRVEVLALSAVGDSRGPWVSAPDLVAGALAASECEVRRLSCADAVSRLLRCRLPLLPPRGSAIFAAATVMAGERASAALRRSRSTTRAASAATCTSAEALMSDDGAATDLSPPGAASLIGAELAVRFKLASSVPAEGSPPPWAQPLGVAFTFSNPTAVSAGDNTFADSGSSFPVRSAPAVSRVQRIIDSVKASSERPDSGSPRFFSAPFSASPLDGDAISMVVARDVAAVISCGSFTRSHAISLCVSALGSRGVSLPSSLASVIKSEAGCAQVGKDSGSIGRWGLEENGFMPVSRIPCAGGNVVSWPVRGTAAPLGPVPSSFLRSRPVGGWICTGLAGDVDKPLVVSLIVQTPPPLLRTHPPFLSVFSLSSSVACFRLPSCLPGSLLGRCSTCNFALSSQLCVQRPLWRHSRLLLQARLIRQTFLLASSLSVRQQRAL